MPGISVRFTKLGLSLGLSAGLVLIGTMSWLTWSGFDNAHKARAWVRHTYDVQIAIDRLALAVRDAETGERGFLLTGDAGHLAPYKKARATLTPLQGELRQLTVDDPQQQRQLDQLSPLIQEKMERLAQAIGLRQDVGLQAALRVATGDGGGGDLMTAIEDRLTALSATEKALLENRTVAASVAERTTKTMAIGMGALALALLACAGALLGHARRRLSRMLDDQRALAGQLRTALDSISQGVGVFDAEWRLERWNECLPVLLELPPKLMRVGTDYAEIAQHLAVTTMNGDPFLETQDQLRHGRAGRAANEPVVYERTRALDRLTFELRRTALPSGKGFVLTITDMTARARSESVLRDAQRMQAVGQLTGGIAHDFNNLLLIIIGNLELIMSRMGAEPEVRQRLERAMWGAKRGAALTAQLLAFARKQPLSPQAVDISAILPEVTGLLRRTLGDHIEVCVVDSAGLWTAMADAAQLESAILNLALNARDAMPGGGRLTIEVANKVLDEDYAASHSEVLPGDYVMLAVSDTGTGMTPHVLARAFEPFFTTKDQGQGQGTGLGLSMVFGFVKQSGGHVKIYSEPGEGTTVRIYLPRAIGVAKAANQRQGAPVSLPRGSATILVVDDAPGVREIATAILRDLGYRVFEAVDGESALRLVSAPGTGAIDLALVDVVLPGGMRGNEVAARIAEYMPDIRTIFMSGYTENSIVHHGRLDDGVTLIAKPFQREQLARKVAEALGPNT